MQGLGRNPGQLAAQVEAELNRRPKVYGTATQVGISQAAQRALQAAQAEADAMKDDYVSTEHLLLALAGKEGWPSRSDSASRKAGPWLSCVSATQSTCGRA